MQILSFSLSLFTSRPAMSRPVHGSRPGSGWSPGQSRGGCPEGRMGREAERSRLSAACGEPSVLAPLFFLSPLPILSLSPPPALTTTCRPSLVMTEMVPVVWGNVSESGARKQKTKNAAHVPLHAHRPPSTPDWPRRTWRGMGQRGVSAAAMGRSARTRTHTHAHARTRARSLTKKKRSLGARAFFFRSPPLRTPSPSRAARAAPHPLAHRPRSPIPCPRPG